jgi:dipeptidyl aminopeptidase/acylaminoacyl peptidase
MDLRLRITRLRAVLVVAVVALVSAEGGAGGMATTGDPYMVVGSRLATNDGRCCQLYEVFKDGGGKWLSLRGTSPDWSEAAQQLAFIRKHRIWIASLDGKARRLEIGNYQATSVTWAPDGKQLAFICGTGSRRRDSNRGVCIATASYSRVRRLVWLTERYGYVDDPVWSPKGDSIAFTRELDLFTVRPDGTRVRRMSPAWSNKTPRWSQLPAWTPSGDRLSYIYGWLRPGQNGCSFLWVRPDGSGRENVPGATLGRACDSVDHLVWSPDGGAIAYSVNRNYCYTRRLHEQRQLIRKPVLGCYGLTWIH